jgi:hypothetical protein
MRIWKPSVLQTLTVKQNKGLKSQNIALKKNISILFKTAKVEVDRKNEEIARLRKEARS